jgi:hypothetical protein
VQLLSRAYFESLLQLSRSQLPPNALGTLHRIRQ